MADYKWSSCKLLNDDGSDGQLFYSYDVPHLLTCDIFRDGKGWRLYLIDDDGGIDKLSDVHYAKTLKEAKAKGVKLIREYLKSALDKIR